MTNLENIEELKGLSKEEREAVFKILNDFSTKGNSDLLSDLKFADFDEVPVDIGTFMHDKNYLGNGLYDQTGRFTVFPYWEEKLKEIFPDNISTRYNTVVFTGAIGLGKSTIAVICLLYLLYRLLCLKDPYLYYGLQPIDKITISLMNITLENAKGVALDKMNQMILSSNWFMTHGEMAGISNLNYVPNKHIELITASSNNQVIGRALFANFTDEVNFGLTNDVEKLKRKQKQLISQIDARMKSRFLRGTYLPTLNIIASSKNSDQSFLDEYIETKKRNETTTTLIVDEPQWVVDSRKDSEEKFCVAIGNKFLANELIPKGSPKDLIEEYRAKGYSILEVPIGYYENFQDNIDGALTDIAGISTQSSTKYISGMRWNEVKTALYENPFKSEIIEVGNAKDDISQYSDYFDLTKVPSEWKAKPMYIHLDMSKKGDKTGIAGVWITGKRPTIEGESSSREMFYRVAFSVAIKAPKGYEISFDKNRTFIRWLKRQGFNIKGVSSDTYNSAQIQQQLLADGFDTSVISVDRLDIETKVCLPYQYLKSAIYERRLEVYKECDFLTEEIIGLEREGDGHINHPENGAKGCFTGDTKVSLVDGRELTFLELIDEFNSGKSNYVYSFNETAKIIEPKLIENAWCTKRNAKLVAVTLDNGEVLKCTPDHKFMLRGGTYKEAKDLICDDSLMPLYRKYPDDFISMKNYRLYYEPIEDAWHYEHRRFAYDVIDEKYLVHHKDCNRDNNRPDNLVWCSKAMHQKLHKELSTGAHSKEANIKRSNSLSKWYVENPEAASLKNHRAGLTLLGLTEEEWLENKLKKESKSKVYWDNAEKNKQKKQDYISAIEHMFNVVWSDLSANEKDSYAVKYQRATNPNTQKVITNKIIENHKLGKYENAKVALAKCNEESKKLKELIPDIDEHKFYEIFGVEYEEVPSNKRAPMITKYRKIVSKEILNHRVVSVKYLDYTEDVYDITVKDNHNFALSAGVFVHNSKDTADAICGSLWNAAKHCDEYAFEYGETLQTIIDVAADNSYGNKDLINKAFEDELTSMFDSSKEYREKVNKEDNEHFMDFGTGKATTAFNANYLSNGIIVF